MIDNFPADFTPIFTGGFDPQPIGRGRPIIIIAGAIFQWDLGLKVY